MIRRQFGTRIKPDYETPPQEMLDSWVDAYKRVGEVLIEEIPFYTRPLTREEYRYAIGRSLSVQNKLEEIVCQKATLWPQQFDFSNELIPAGLVPQLAAHILELSAFTPEGAKKLLEFWQERVYEQEERRDLLIQLAFPHMTYDVLDRMDAEEYFHYLAAAELRVRTQIMTSTNPVFSPDEFVDILMCTKDELNERMDKAAESIEQMSKKEEQGQKRNRPYGR